MDLILPGSAPGALIAHRGVSFTYPENTLPAYEQARHSGFGWIEVDTQLTRDGQAVMMHDTTVDRTTNGQGYVCEMDFADLRQLDATRNYSDFNNVPVPTLEETLALVLKYDLGLILEIKPTPGTDFTQGRAIADLVNRLWPRDNDKLVVSSFSAPCLMAFRKEAGWASLAFASEAIPDDPGAYMDLLGVSAFHLQYHFALGDGLERLLETGAHVAAATVNDAETARRLLDAGVHGVMTDHADLLKG